MNTGTPLTPLTPKVYRKVQELLAKTLAEIGVSAKDTVRLSARESLRPKYAEIRHMSSNREHSVRQKGEVLSIWDVKHVRVPSPEGDGEDIWVLATRQDRLQSRFWFARKQPWGEPL